LADLEHAVPSLLATVRAATAAAPSLTQLLGIGTPFITRAGGLFNSLTPMLACIRPYTPEAASAVQSAGGWTQDYVVEPRNSPQGPLLNEPQRFNGAPEGTGVRVHGIRAMPQVSTTSFHAYPLGLTTKLFTQLTGKQYAEPRPPGLSVGQPWLLPECGVSSAALDPAQDPEQR
jgi:hypothetical protein